MAVDEAGRERAARYAVERLARHGWSPAELAMRAGVDPGTVRDFLNGERWPQQKSRTAIENALDLGRGTLELVARGIAGTDPEPHGDAVEMAIFGSRLTRANQHRLVGIYYGMLEDQERGAERGSA